MEEGGGPWIQMFSSTANSTTALLAYTGKLLLTITVWNLLGIFYAACAMPDPSLAACARWRRCFRDRMHTIVATTAIHPADTITPDSWLEGRTQLQHER